MTVADIQKAHFDTIQRRYEAHYDDACSRRYRDRFFHERMFRGVDLAGKTVLEAMCGSGQTTSFLLSKGATVTGLDVSEESITSFCARWPSCRAIRASVLESNLESEAFDLIVVVGGLHHLHPHISAAIVEFHRFLKPAGFFCFVEPHRGSLPDWVRRRWYRRDDLFAKNEDSVDLDSMKREFADCFDFLLEDYLGNVAYLLVLNSMVFRVPLKLKPLYTPPLMVVESALVPLQTRLLSCVAVSRWQKR